MMLKIKLGNFNRYIRKNRYIRIPATILVTTN